MQIRVFVFFAPLFFRKPFWEQFWRHFGSKKGAKIEQKTQQKSDRNLYQIWNRFLLNFWAQVRVRHLARSTPLPWTPPFRASPHQNVITRTSLFPLPGLARNGKSEIGAGAKRSFLDPFWPFLAQNGFTLGRFGAHVGPFGPHFGTLLWLICALWGPLWDPLGPMLALAGNVVQI